MRIKTSSESFFVYTFSSFRQNENICFHCDAYQYKKKCQIRNFVTKYWHCCFDDKISKNIVKSENDFDALKIMFDDFNKNNLRVLVDAIKIELQNLLWQMKMNSNTNLKRKTQFNTEFQKLEIAYNNVLSFCNEFSTIDRINNAWTTYRCQNSIKHLLEILFVEFDDVKRFAQIHIIDFIQKTLKRRMKSNIDDDVLNEIVLLRLQRLFKKINFYCKDLKTCAKRIKKSDQSEIKIHLKQNDFNRRERNTMNKSTFDEIVIVIIIFDIQNDENSINKNIFIQI